MKRIALGIVALFTTASGFAADVHYATNPVPDTWIVEVEASVGRGAATEALANSLAAAHGGEVGFLYDGRLRGFVLRVPDQALAGLAQHPLINSLVQDERYEGILSEAAPYCYNMPALTNTRPLPGISPGTVQTLECTEPEVGSGGPTCIDNWGLDRIGEESLPPDYRYQWPANGGQRRIYVFDTGVRSSHREFEGLFGNSRVTHLFNQTPEPDGDFYGHGTHVAGIAAGRTHGVAKWVDVYDVKIVTGTAPPSTYLSWMLAGLQAIGDHMTSMQPTGIAVVNWSGGNEEPFVSGTDKQHVVLRQELVAVLQEHENLLLVQSAGNDNVDACERSFGDDALFPTVFDQILIAGGSDPSDRRLMDSLVTSNHGECVDLFAPAAVVVSAFNSFDEAACQLSGTSMAAPHVSGTAAVLSSLFPSEDAAGIRDLVIASATPDVLDPSTLGPKSPNLLLTLPAADGVIFDDDFDGLGNWPINVATGNGQNSVCSGYCAGVASAADTAYLGDTRPAGEYVYRVAFLLDPGDLAFGPNSEVTLLRARGAGDATLFELLMETGPSAFGQEVPSLKVVVQTNSGPVEELVELPDGGSLMDPTLQLEFEWVPSAFTSEPRGFFRLWSGLVALQNVQLEVSLDDLDTHGMTVESALLGVVGASGSVVGELRFSDFKSRREDRAISF